MDEYQVKGNGVELLMYVFRKATSSTDPAFAKAAIRLVAEAALHDETEPLFFNAGAFELAARVARTVRLRLRLRCVALVHEDSLACFCCDYRSPTTTNRQQTLEYFNTAVDWRLICVIADKTALLLLEKGR